MKTPQNKMIIAPQTKNLTPEELISKAIDRKIPVETMEKLLGMRRELRQEYAREEYIKAMAKFQAHCPIITKTKEVPTRSGKIAYKYAPIDSIVSQVKGLLEQYGFSYTTDMEILPDSLIRVTVKVNHIAGHSETSTMTVPLGYKTDIMSQSQVVAAAQTFAKRYAFCNAFGILTNEEDNDAIEDREPDLFERALELVRSQNNPQLLSAYREKISESDKYTQDQKENLLNIIASKLQDDTH